jgi:hypothetical protein
MSSKQSLTSRSVRKNDGNNGRSFMLGGPATSNNVSSSFSELTDELTSSSVFTKLSERDIEAIFTFKDWIRYRLDLFVASNPDSRFLFLILSTFAAMMIIAGVWGSIKHQDSLESTYTNFQDALFMTFLVTTTGDFNIDVEKRGEYCCSAFIKSACLILTHVHTPFVLAVCSTAERLVFAVAVLVGIIVIAVLIGIVTDTVGSAMSSVASGKSKVIEENHT